MLTNFINWANNKYISIKYINKLRRRKSGVSSVDWPSNLLIHSYGDFRVWLYLIIRIQVQALGWPQKECLSVNLNRLKIKKNSKLFVIIKITRNLINIFFNTIKWRVSKFKRLYDVQDDGYVINGIEIKMISILRCDTSASTYW